MERDWFIFYRSVWEVALQLSDEDRLKYYDRVIKYWLFWDDKQCGWLVDMMFTLIKPNLDANNKKYADWCKWKSHWSKWWRPRKNPTGDIVENPTAVEKITPNDNDTVHVTENADDVVQENYNVSVKEETEKTPVGVPSKPKSIINKQNKPWAVEIYDKIKEMCVVVDGTLDDCVVLRSKLVKYWNNPVNLLEIMITKMRDSWLNKFYSISNPWKLADNIGTIVEKLKSEEQNKKSFIF